MKLVGKEDLPMSWKETCAMQERMEFVSELLEGNRTMTELCLIRGVSRKTGHKWWAASWSMVCRGCGIARARRSIIPMRYRPR